MRKIQSVILIFIFVASLFCSSGCRREEHHIHEGFEEFENYIYQDLPDCIQICQPEYHVETDQVLIQVFFSKNYLKNIPDELPKYAVIDRFMALYNSFIVDHQGYFFGGDNKVMVWFLEDAGDHTDTIAEISNYHSYKREFIWLDKLISATYYCPVDYYQLECTEDIIHMSFGYADSSSGLAMSDYFCSVIGLFPNMKYVHISWSDPDGEIEAKITEAYPDIVYE